MRIAGLSPDSSWSHTLFPYDPAAGARNAAAPRGEQVIEIDDPDQIDAFFASGAGR